MAMTLRLTPELDAKLDIIAAQLGVSKQLAVEAAIERYDAREKRQAQMNEALNLVLTRDAELMERLADA